MTGRGPPAACWDPINFAPDGSARELHADIDVEHNYIVNSLVGTDPRIRRRVIGNFSTGYHCRNGGGDEVRADGNLPVVDQAGDTIGDGYDDLPSAVVRAARGYPGIGDLAAGAAASADPDLPPQYGRDIRLK
ncbi:LssY C-terminal domain-containing protein [Corynebacterium sp. CCM 9185]|uniref:LssY C-terminal domain-containing protein n=1 Tax=Corynebacterium marambiense TaxID=2765364 RepID=A0ABS0VVV9_9CORY|nr:LssY C-terminal domain-containing protein [Corynebacterium marambiense]MBI9000885.1 LssY C-terminal domain-containing protein [Corynebacterium marambiense]MCK7662847.1 LssY C-terminal domain-containing protein [Corynebacterium marambiense]